MRVMGIVIDDRGNLRFVTKVPELVTTRDYHPFRDMYPYMNRLLRDEGSLPTDQYLPKERIGQSYESYCLLVQNGLNIPKDRRVAIKPRQFLDELKS
jgi:hypothetical protein